MAARTDVGVRPAIAVDALAELGPHRAEHRVLGVRCRRAHRLADVYETRHGLVLVSRTGGGTEYVAVLRADRWADDALPACCECGPATLSRSDLLASIGAREHLVRLG